MTTMHDELESKLIDYVYGELSREERERFAARIQRYPDLMEEVRADQRTRSIMKLLPSLEPCQSVLESVMREARNRGYRGLDGDEGT